jgi:hypothetical protein
LGSPVGHPVSSKPKHINEDDDDDDDDDDDSTMEETKTCKMKTKTLPCMSRS